LVFVFGIFGIPKGIGPSARKTALTDRIHLGLDLKGGIHLVLQVMVDEAGSAETKNAAARARPVFKQAGTRGTHQILVELPGVDDLSRVRDIIQSTARLEIHLVVGGPFSTEQAAAQSVGGTVPPEDVVMGYGGNEPELQGQYYVLQRLPIVAGDDFRDAQPSVDENGRPDATFILTRNAGDRFYQFTSTNIGKQLPVVLDNRVQEAANIQQAIRDQGRITGLGKDKARSDE